MLWYSDKLYFFLETPKPVPLQLLFPEIGKQKKQKTYSLDIR